MNSAKRARVDKASSIEQAIMSIANKHALGLHKWCKIESMLDGDMMCVYHGTTVEQKTDYKYVKYGNVAIPYDSLAHCISEYVIFCLAGTNEIIGCRLPELMQYTLKKKGTNAWKKGEDGDFVPIKKAELLAQPFSTSLTLETLNTICGLSKRNLPTIEFRP